MDVKVRVFYAWPNDQLSPDFADLWPNVGMAMAILDFMSIGIDTKRDWQMKSFSWCLPLNAKEGYRCVILILTSRVLTHTWSTPGWKQFFNTLNSPRKRLIRYWSWVLWESQTIFSQIR